MRYSNSTPRVSVYPALGGGPGMLGGADMLSQRK
ncbi:hypothetical protein COLO4_23234 [Corchorus olitorius]|uniref:Uncharacterized protein n=1 Tax=Corchorus olitorius TaxID=93759 RepID=A0A1R3IHQ8_9ROSI|nr:hypothetical protein COLO4_23234 [Corchorus olitorius]